MLYQGRFRDITDIKKTSVYCEIGNGAHCFTNELSACYVFADYFASKYESIMNDGEKVIDHKTYYAKDESEATTVTIKTDKRKRKFIISAVEM